MVSKLAFLLLTAVLVITPRISAAQVTTSTQSGSRAPVLDPDDPRGKRAAAFAKLLLESDPTEAIKYLKAHAVPGSPAATDIEKQVNELRTPVAAAKFTVDRITAGTDEDVLVTLMNADGARGGRVGVRVQIERAAPHRIREVARIQGRREISGGL